MLEYLYRIIQKLKIEFNNVSRYREAKISWGCVIDKKSIVGKGVYVGRCCDITESIICDYASIGNFCVIGPGVHDLDSENLSVELNPNQNLRSGQCIIGYDAWIGTGAVILRGVSIGKGAVVGAGSIVTKDVPDYAVAVGVPAKILRYRMINK